MLNILFSLQIADEDIMNITFLCEQVLLHQYHVTLPDTLYSCTVDPNSLNLTISNSYL